MSVDDYMKKSLASQERIIALLETIAGNTAGRAVGVKAEATPAKGPAASAAGRTSGPAQKTAPIESSESSSKTAPPETAAAAEPAGKRVTVDEARKALKAYAAIEGNDAAMELLQSLGAGSISGLHELDPTGGKLAELVRKCGGGE